MRAMAQARLLALKFPFSEATPHWITRLESGISIFEEIGEQEEKRKG